MTLAGGALLPELANAQNTDRKLLIVVAHPDDEYTFAGAVYRLVRESGWTADQVIVTNGESGYRYATLAEAFYGLSFAPTTEGRANLSEVRKKEAINAGKILGIQRHYFLDQRDLGFETEAKLASTSNWDYAYVRGFLSSLLIRERYDAVFTLLPTAETHGHHRAATLLALQAIAELAGDHPAVFGAEPRGIDETVREFSDLPGQTLARAVEALPVLVFDRHQQFGYRQSLDYQIVTNWLIAEHKTQGLFQTDYNRHGFEQFWLLAESGDAAAHTLSELQVSFQTTRPDTVAQKGTHK
jgi:LmbE family N-acetylglucosaminyl deacetylase